MANFDGLISTIIHALVEKIGLSSTTRTLLFPHIPKIVNTLSLTLENNNINELICEYYIFLIIGILICILYYYKNTLVDYINILINYWTNKKPNKDKVKEDSSMPFTASLTIESIIEVVTVIKYLMDNANNSNVLKIDTVKNIEFISTETTNSKLMNVKKNYGVMTDPFSDDFIESQFMCGTIEIPTHIVCEYYLDRKEFNTDSVKLLINTTYNYTSINEKKYEDENGNEYENQNNEETSKIEMIKMIISVTYSNSDFNFIQFVNYFKTMIKEHNKKKIQKRKLMNRTEIITKYDPNDVGTILLYDGPIISDKKRIEIYLGSFIHQTSEELISMVNNFLNDCKQQDFEWSSSINPHLALLVYGGPGSGKSTLADRLALALKRDVIIYPISKYSTIISIKQFMRNYRIRSSIVLIDEFDQFIIDVREDNKRYEDFLEEIKNSDDREKKTNEYIRKYNFTPEELLPLFDSSYRGSGTIIIATTNNPDIIKDIGRDKTKGAMLRAGRLKLFRMGYFDRSTAEKLLKLQYGNNHGIILNNKWFDENNEIIVQNSNFIEILKTIPKEKFAEKIDNDIKEFKSID
jgi:energy-coupling factor transporter ATP-binding protein EcfA2